MLSSIKRNLQVPVLLIMLALSACKKLIEIRPPATQLTRTNVYADNSTSAAVLTGIYSRMSSYGFATGGGSISLKAGLSADELQLWADANNADLQQYYQNALVNTNSTFWSELYTYIHTVNSAIEGLSSSTSLTMPVKRQLIGEAKFMRAFLNFYLVNLFGNVPIITSSDYNVNRLASRASERNVYQRIIDDLKDAQQLLSADFLSADAVTLTSERVRPTKWAATALLARTYLYIKDWPNAEQEAAQLIDQTALFQLLPDLNAVFLANSMETIWQLQPNNPGFNTLDGNLFVLTSGPNSYGNYVYLGNGLLNSFEAGDSRRENWIGVDSSTGTTYYFPFKYKIYAGSELTEYLTVLRLAEQYLIRSEARAQQNNLAGARQDLNTIRQRAGLANTMASTQSALLLAIAHERRFELFTEWGHRWLDLKRTGKINEVMTDAAIAKGATWNTNWKLYPIPLTDLQANPNLTQNLGY